MATVDISPAPGPKPGEGLSFEDAFALVSEGCRGRLVPMALLVALMATLLQRDTLTLAEIENMVGRARPAPKTGIVVPTVVPGRQ